MDKNQSHSSKGNALGGYFDFEFSRNGTPLYSEAHSFQSARAAFRALLQSGRPREVWMPWLICDSMLAPLKDESIRIHRYNLDEMMLPIVPNVLGPNVWLIYVNYFGICDDQVVKALDRFPSRQLVIDNSQAFFFAPLDCLANIYSPRKFLGVPDGGYLITELEIEKPDIEDKDSLKRLEYLLLRWDSGPESGYEEYQLAEKSLSDTSPKKMSKLTRRLLARNDYNEMIEQRRRNFVKLHQALGSLNLFAIPAKCPASPISYPFLSSAKIREQLISNRVYIPCYWEEVIRNSPATSLENIWASKLVHIPIDHRYNAEEILLRIADILIEVSH